MKSATFDFDMRTAMVALEGKDPASAEAFLEALKKAGFPDAEIKP